MIRNMKSLAMVLLIVLATLIFAACSKEPSPTASTPIAKTYIATLQGAPASARAVLVEEEGKFDAYVCSLDDSFNVTSARWYKGALDPNGNFQGTSTDGVVFQGRVQGDQFSGTLRNTAQQTFAFSGAAVPVGGKAGLYRGIGKYENEDVIVGTVLSVDGSFAATAQHKSAFKFVSPVASPPVELGNNRLGVKIGPSSVQITVELVTTLKGASIF